MLRIRLTRRGAKKDPHYRVVVTEKASPRDGRFVEIVGYYNPALNPVRLNLNLERVDYWVKNGAQPTETVKTLIRRVKEQQKAEPLEELVEQEA
ncbi:MAG: 30S ribosomal protein S16 [bacterium]